MAKVKTRIGRARRRVALQAFLCGAVWGVAVAQGSILFGGRTAAAALMAFGVCGLAVMILGMRLGATRRRSEELADMLRSVHAGLVVLDAAEICVAVGGKLRELLEMPADWDPTGLAIAEILTELADRGDFGTRVPPSLPVDPALFRSPDFPGIYLETPRGRILSVAVSELPQGGWVLTYTDITEHKEQTRTILRAQRELEMSEARARQLAAEAEAANAAKSAFLASMSHEIRTPMNGVIGMSEVLAETELSEDQQAQVATIRQSAESLLVVINDILDFSKIEAGHMTLDSAPFNLRRTIEDVLKLVGPGARQRGLAVLLDYGTGLAEEYVGDFQRLRQILINLIGNAVKFTPQGSVVVRVRGQARAGRMALEIAVEDTGIGIAREHISHLFSEFARVEGSSTRHFEGTGLGLAICKRLVQMMAGEITVASELGVGTTFTLRLKLPLAEDAMRIERHLPAPAPARPAGPPTAKRLLVLMAEDNRTNQIVVSMMLEDEAIDLRIAANGREAVALFRELVPDLVLMDVSMPEMDGFAATAAIRRLEAEHGLARTPIVALTAHSGNEHRALCLENDMDDYLSKPLNRPDLISMVFAHGEPAMSRPARPAIAALERVGAVPCA